MTIPIDSTAYRSPNYDQRPQGMAIDSIVVHTTEGTWPSDIQWLCSKSSGVSCHYVVSPAGGVYQIVSDDKRAWHAGESSYAGRTNYNSFSIGIEVSHQQGHAYGPAQIPAVTELCTYLLSIHPITRKYVAMHRQVATPPGRKSDPTDVSDPLFAAWADRLFTPSYFPIIVLAPCAVLTGPAPDAPLAGGPNGGQTWLVPGSTVNCGQIDDGWAWISDSPQTAPGIGFVCASYVRRV